MFDLTQNTHPLTRDGKSQADRQNLRALSPDFARPDSRDEKQILAYLYEFAKAVIFEDEKGVKDNWQEFFRTGSSVQLALISQFDPETLQTDFKDAQMRLADGLEAGNFYPLLDFLFETALSIDRWHKALSSDTEFIDGQLIINESPLRLTIQNLIQSNLQTALKQLIGTANSISDFNVAPLSIQYETTQNAEEKEDITQKINRTIFSLPSFEDETKRLWELSQADFVLRDATLQSAMNTPLAFNAVAMERLTDLFSTFYKGVSKIVADTEGVSILQSTQLHEPHLGLLYAFLRLFGFVQSDLNQMPKRHLDFYFRQVLGLKPRPFVPDEVHLIFEPNKPFNSAKIDLKTLLLDGKDSRKAEIQFATTDELIATQAQIAALRTLHFGTFQKEKTTLFAAPIANSADGNGAPFAPEMDTSWAALGSTFYTALDADKHPVSKIMPTARVGLLVASPALRLAEGLRTLTLKLGLPLVYYNITQKGLEILRNGLISLVDIKPSSFFSIEKDKKNAIKAYYEIVDERDIPDGTFLLEVEQNINTALNLIQSMFEYHISKEAFEILTQRGIAFDKTKSDLFISSEKDKVETIKSHLGIQQQVKLDDIVDFWNKVKGISLSKVIQKRVQYSISKKALALLIKKGIAYDATRPTSFVSVETKNKAVKDNLGITSNLKLEPDFWKNVERIPVFDIQLSGKKGWFRPNALPKIAVTDDGLTIRIALPPDNEAVVIADPSVLKADFGVSEALMELVLNHNILNGTNSFYEIFKNANLVNVSLRTTAMGVSMLIPQSDVGLLDAAKPFQPFGAQPKNGDAFYIGSNEIFRKKLASLKLNLTWKDLPTNFRTYYKHYQNPPTKKSFKVSQAVLQNGTFINVDGLNATQLFKSPMLLPLPNDLLTTPLELTQFIKGETSQGFVRLTLNQGFKHDEYLNVAIKRGAQIAALDPKNTTADRSMPNVPYTPIIQSMTMNYRAEDTTTNTLQLFHLHPFDETNRNAIGIGDSFLPKFETSENKPIEGALYIGLQEAQASETLSILFQLNEPSADSYLAAAKIEWSYLVDNEWHKLNDGEHILSDTTEGFIRSGIVQLVLPFEISSKNTTLLPPQYLWLRAATDVRSAARSAATCRVIGVHTQAVRAVFENNANDLMRLDVPLAAGSLKKMVDPLAEIKSVAQPYDSFGGRSPEAGTAFYVRSSERLRHKGRAITLNDYESLVLAAFPDIYKVKCINHSLAQRVSEGAKDKLIAPGYVTVVVIPNLATRPLAERFEPKVSRGRLDDITDFLKSRIAPFVKLTVMNPIFEPIYTQSKITFKEGKSPAFYKNQLDLDLKRHLAPWAFDPTAKIEFGGEIFPSAILGFIEQREYVDFVEDFTVSKIDPSVTAVALLEDEGVLTTATARGIFVSGKHKITTKVNEKK